MMKLLYTHENKIIVENAKNYLEAHGVETILKNEYASGGMGELSPIETWPELWVTSVNYDAGKKIIDTLLNTPIGETWFCSVCGEKNEATFKLCWNCQNEKGHKVPVNT